MLSSFRLFTLATIDEQILSELDQYLFEYVYEKVYFEVSNKCKEILLTIKDDKPIKMEDIANKINKTAKYVSVYRDILIKEGILFSPSYGYVQFSLPRFDNFLKTK